MDTKKEEQKYEKRKSKFLSYYNFQLKEEK